ncbi:MAG: phosphoserine phosphatase RsbU/P [Gaiellaceae bacterium]|nr:phosphoserine phosphatase RsbU/P [Gaiellaceae bacterium]
MTPKPTASDVPEQGLTALLAESAEELYEDAPVGYLSTATDGTILRCNRTFLAFSGYDTAELVGRRFYDLLPPGAKIYYETHYAPLLEMQQEVREIALEIIRADGRRLPVLVNAQVKRNTEGNPALVRITVLDATARRQYERELLRARADAESRAAAASALQHINEGVVLVDDDGKIVVLNRAASRLFGLSTEEDAVGAPLSTMVRGWAAIVSRIPVVSAGETVNSVVVPMAVEGDTRWVAASGELAPDGTVYTLRDVTAERRLEDFRDDIVAIVSHELRTPLAGVYGAAQTLATRGADLSDGARQGLVDMIVEQSGRLSRILDEILMTQRLDGGDLRLASESFGVLSTVVRVIERSHDWRNARPVRVLESEDVVAVGDPVLFEQALVNLLDNAMKYSPGEGEIRVWVGRHRSSARVTISDDGPGVAAEDQERIFEKFFRVDPAQITGVAGTGLGLYITREVVRRMQGRVGLLRADTGATFFIDLPVAQ